MGNFIKGLLDPTTPNTGNLDSIIETINSIVTILLGLVTTGVVILAIFLAYRFFTANDEEKRKNAKAQMIYAIIGVIVMIVLLILAPIITGFLEGALTEQP